MKLHNFITDKPRGWPNYNNPRCKLPTNFVYRWTHRHLNNHYQTQSTTSTISSTLVATPAGQFSASANTWTTAPLWPEIKSNVYSYLAIGCCRSLRTSTTCGVAYEFSSSNDNRRGTSCSIGTSRNCAGDDIELNSDRMWSQGAWLLIRRRSAMCRRCAESRKAIGMTELWRQWVFK